MKKLNSRPKFTRLTGDVERNTDNSFWLPIKRNKRGRRYYSRENVESIAIIYDLLRVRKFTIEGAKLELEKRGLMDNKHFLKA